MLMTSRVLEECDRASRWPSSVRGGWFDPAGGPGHKPIRRCITSPLKTRPRRRTLPASEDGGVEVIGSRVMVAIPASPQVLIRTLNKYTVLDLVGGREDSEESFLRFHGDDVV